MKSKRGRSARDKLAEYFKDNVGVKVSADELQDVAGISEWARRIRELRADGWPIMTNNDDVSLKPGEYMMTSKSPPPVSGGNYVFRGGISQKLRAYVLDRNGYTCQMCGVGAGEPDDHGRPTRLHVGHITDKSHGGTNDPSNLRALCSACNQGAKNLMQEPPSRVWLLGQVRRAKVDDQRAVLEWLEKRFGGD